MTYDCFSFFNELDLLEIRLNVLNDVVDKFVLVEATKTHTGNLKPLYYNENKARYAAFADKIVHIVVDDFPNPPAHYTERQASWMRENFQRNAIMHGLADAKDNDLIIISDLDEIPSPEAIRKAEKHDAGITVCEQWFMNYYLNYLDYVRPYWKGSRILRPSVLKEAPRTVPPHFAFIEEVNLGTTPTRVRLAKADRMVHHAGWHFSYLGGVKSIIKKIHSVGIEYAERYQYTEAEIIDRIHNGVGIAGNGGMYFAISNDRILPWYVVSHKALYSHLFFTPPETYWAKTRWRRIRCSLRGWIRRNVAKLIPNFLKPWLFAIYCKIVSNPINQ